MSVVPLETVRPDVVRLPILFVNAYLVGDPGGPWALVDTGLPFSSGLTRSVAAERFGGRPPEAIVLTHGHFDHAGSAAALAEAWDVPVYAHALEMPYLTGRSSYAPPDRPASASPMPCSACVNSPGTTHMVFDSLFAISGSVFRYR